VQVWKATVHCSNTLTDKACLPVCLGLSVKLALRTSRLLKIAIVITANFICLNLISKVINFT
jgi:hypothetical protein